MEHKVVFQAVYYLLRNKVKLEFSYLLHTTKKIQKLNKQSSLGTKIKYYRRLNDIKQEELASRLGVSRDSIMAIENQNKDYYNIDLLNEVVDTLKIRDILEKSTTYVGFLLNNPKAQIKEYRICNNLTKTELAKHLKVHRKTIERWEDGTTTINHKHYKRFKELTR